MHMPQTVYNYRLRQAEKSISLPELVSTSDKHGAVNYEEYELAPVWN